LRAGCGRVSRARSHPHGAGGVTEDAIGERVQIGFSRTDADGGLREARISV
jgi:hypothetical protein